MSEIKEMQLSTDINIITAEINSYKHVAGQAIFEIGIRIKKVHDEKLAEARGGWTNWLREIEMSTSQADRFLKIIKEINLDNFPTLGSKPFVALYEISNLPEEERTKPHTIPSTGEQKTVDEMTVRELREVKTELRAKEEELKREQLAKQALLDTVESMQSQSQEVRTITQTIEVTPLSVKREIDDLNLKLKRLSQGKLEAEEKLLKAEEYLKSEEREIEKLRKEKEKLELEAHISISGLQIGIHKFIEEYSPNVFLQGAVAASGNMIKDDLLDSIYALEEFTQTLRSMLDAKITKKYIDVEIN